MFETATLTYEQGSKRLWSTFAGLTGQLLFVVCAVIVPMVWPAALPRAVWITSISAPTPPPPPPLQGETRIRPKTAVPVESQFARNILTLPTRIPPKAAAIIDEAPVAAGNAGVEGGMAGGDPNGVIGGLLRSIASDAARVTVVKPSDIAALPTVKPAAAVTKPARVSALEMAHPIRRVEPTYPPLARQMRIAGVVELQGVLGTDGHIHELKVLRGHPMLVQAALEAVKQWTYAPTILNGQAVEVVAPIVVTFRLN